VSKFIKNESNLRYFIEIAFKGTNFHGWQIQPNATSIQETIQNGMETLLGQKIEIIGAGRTDAGVHATQIFAHFDSDKTLNTKDLTYKLNAVLPKTILVKQIFKVSKNAHARFDAFSRSYEYRIHKEFSPFDIDTTWQIVNRDFDIKKMNKAAQALLQHTNFKAFSKSKTDVKHYDCNITRAEWVEIKSNLVFYISANRFLRGMVRAIVGTLLEVGEGKLSVVDFEKVILGQNRKNAGVSVPAKALFLTAVRYPDTISI